MTGDHKERLAQKLIRTILAAAVVGFVTGALAMVTSLNQGYNIPGKIAEFVVGTVLIATIPAALLTYWTERFSPRGLVICVIILVAAITFYEWRVLLPPPPIFYIVAFTILPLQWIGIAGLVQMMMPPATTGSFKPKKGRDSRSWKSWL